MGSMIPWVLPLFHWCDGSWLSLEIRGSRWQFAIIEMIHLLGLTLLLGSMVVLDLRLLGYGLRRQSPSQLARELSVWVWRGFWVILISGILLFFGEPMKLYGSPSFFVKMVLFVIAVAVQLIVMYRVRKTPDISPGLGRVAGVLSLVTWFGVGLAGRAIGFL